jgi:hypothetical protein
MSQASIRFSAREGLQEAQGRLLDEILGIRPIATDPEGFRQQPRTDPQDEWLDLVVHDGPRGAGSVGHGAYRSTGTTWAVDFITWGIFPSLTDREPIK